MTPRSPLVVALTFALVGFASAPAYAHAMRLKVSVGAEIVAKTTYDGDDHDGGDVTVRVQNANKEVIATGKIGADGYWRTPAPKEYGKYLVVAEDDFGHRAQQEIEIGALPPDAKPREYRANEPPVESGLAVILGIAAIGAATLAGYWFFSRNKS